MKLLIPHIILLLLSSLLAEEVMITIDKKTLKGELKQTENKTSRIAFILSGSGPTDRDGNTVGVPGKNNSLKYLSEYLNEEGIPTLRVDKRGVGASSAASSKEIDLRFSRYVEDVDHWINFLKQKGFSEIVLIGHSEGALVGTLAAKNDSVIKLISIAGAGEPAQVILRRQLKKNLPKGLYDRSDEIITKLTEGETIKKVPPSLASLFRPSVQPYLISWFKLDPAKAISDLSIPVLVVQGDTDLQTSISDAKLLDAATKDGEIKIIKGMNHVLKEIEGDLNAQLSSYFNPEIPIHTDLGSAILKFIVKPIKIPNVEQ